MESVLDLSLPWQRPASKCMHINYGTMESLRTIDLPVWGELAITYMELETPFESHLSRNWSKPTRLSANFSGRNGEVGGSKPTLSENERTLSFMESLANCDRLY